MYKEIKKYWGKHFLWFDYIVATVVAILIQGLFGSAYLLAISPQFWITALLLSLVFVSLWWWQYVAVFYIHAQKAPGGKWLRLLKKNKAMPKADFMYLRSCLHIAFCNAVLLWAGKLTPPLGLMWIVVTNLLFLWRCWWFRTTVIQISNKTDAMPLIWKDELEEDE